MDIIVIFKAILLGVIEGLTEFLPVSSTGHLILIGEQLKFNHVPDMIFETSIQFGAILAVIVFYKQKIKDIFFNFYHKSKEQDLVINLFIAFLPAAIIGLLTHNLIKTYLFNSHIVAISLIFGGVIMIVIDYMKLKLHTRNIYHISKKQALSIGLFQCLAMIPGMSRSGSTIIGGMCTGLSRATAAEFSFFLAIPTILAASLYDLVKNYKLLSLEHLNIIAIGFATSFVIALFVVAFFIEMIKKYGFKPFGVYRIILGFIIILYL